MHLDRSSGILLHVSSLPSQYGIGDLGPSAYRFVDYLSAAGQRIWQVLPLVPIGYGYSPYSGTSTFAGNTLLISPDLLIEEDLLTREEADQLRCESRDKVDYPGVIDSRRRMLSAVHSRFRRDAGPGTRDRFLAFCREADYWLPDYVLFSALKDEIGDQVWTEWPAEIARRDKDALEDARRKFAVLIEMHALAQYLFDVQWKRIRSYAESRSIRIFGDLPIYVAHDSADVWSHPDLFHLDGDGTPRVVAGVPPDYFSETGQRWGNPLYRWDVMEQNGFRWWTQRFERSFDLFDILRLDHFRAFEAYWEIPASEPTAVSGRWVSGPRAALFRAVERNLGSLPIVAEDLGIITPDVTALMDELGFPGMAVLQFAFGGGPESAYLPHNFRPHLVAYTGTHDNDTTAGWYSARSRAPAESIEAKEYQYARDYFRLDSADVRWSVIRWMMASVASVVVFPMQDVLGLGSSARMNIPGREEGNWVWRMSDDQVREADAAQLREMVRLYGR